MKCHVRPAVILDPVAPTSSDHGRPTQLDVSTVNWSHSSPLSLLEPVSCLGSASSIRSPDRHTRLHFSSRCGNKTDCPIPPDRPGKIYDVDQLEPAMCQRRWRSSCDWPRLPIT
ncbi:hypothetical protein J6590_035596 [Homalodisca vitripennis]|nr:hypothetical protein J6590_035596 [Homalodisca vitripennis]